MENQANELQKSFQTGDILGSPYMPQSFSEKLKLAEVLAQSGLCPKDMNTPQKVFVALQMGHELGLSPMVSINNIAVINGRPSLMTDIMRAVVFKAGKIKDYSVTKNKNDDGQVISVTAKAKRIDFDFEYESTFSLDDAIEAELLTKKPDGGLTSTKDNWRKYKTDMLEHRANSRLFKKLCPELLAGFLTPDEAEDLPPIRDVTPTSENALSSAILQLKKREVETDYSSFDAITELEEVKKGLQEETAITEKKDAPSQPKQAEKQPKKAESKKPTDSKKTAQESPLHFNPDEVEEAFDPETAIKELLPRAKKIKSKMDSLSLEYFTNIATAINEKQFDYELYTKSQHENLLNIVEQLEEEVGSEK